SLDEVPFCGSGEVLERWYWWVTHNVSILIKKIQPSLAGITYSSLADKYLCHAHLTYRICTPSAFLFSLSVVQSHQAFLCFPRRSSRARPGSIDVQSVFLVSGLPLLPVDRSSFPCP